MEAAAPDSTKLITREYQELYVSAQGQVAGRIGMTQRELVLIWLFTALYVAFGAGLILSLFL